MCAEGEGYEEGVERDVMLGRRQETGDSKLTSDFWILDSGF